MSTQKVSAAPARRMRHRAAGGGPASPVDRAVARLAEVLPRLTSIDGWTGLLLAGTDRALFVHGARQVIQVRKPADVGVSLTLTPEDLLRLLDAQMEPRAGVMFGQIRVTGSVPAALRFCDAVSGTRRRRPRYRERELPRPTGDVARARDDLRRFGYCLVSDALAPGEIGRLRRRLREQADGEAAANLASFDGGPGGPNQRVWTLINKGREFEALLDHELIDAFVPEFLGENAIIFSYSANIAGPGGEPQILHYDQISIQPPLHDVMVGLNFAFFLDNVSDANGGTRIMPCSGARGAGPDNPFSIEGTIAAEGPAGTVLIWDSRVWHGTGPNRTGGKRHVILLYFNRAFMRAQENWSLSLRDDVRARLSDRVLTMLGFRVTNTIGGVEGPREGQLVSRPAAPIGRLAASGKP